ncbi:hypothetical protein L198_05236 [Cryptococcus wingfieldii CBS 7118]|uniref:Uncharacterized protein n=1 Tax=Cryptococcus wingfieldii CBS 7118 TaxID=1295528 RepID=A0A1E3J0H0_9TREE|nr:hypothetical protein L198_05236 [Cryptococcus wingfieldii CBS 7118]ODN94377.1 hypothetical protein L198_05236 [Cryptococcus wingfieldii CBS 7118]
MAEASASQYQKGEIAELKATSLQLTSRVDAIDARFRPRPSSHPEYIEVNARFDDVCQMVLGRINPIAKEDDPTAAYAASKLSELVEEHLGELSRRQRGKLAEVIGRFQAGRDYYAVQVDTKISPNTQAFRATIFGSCAKDLRSLLEG